MNCPKCGAINPPDAQACACGYNLGIGLEEQPQPGRPPQPPFGAAREKRSAWKLDWASLIGGILASLGVVLLGLCAGRLGQIVLGTLGMGALGIVGFGLLAYASAQASEDKGGCGKEIALLGGALGGLGGMIVGAIMGAREEPFEWWIWPLAVLGGMALGSALGSWIHQFLSRPR